MTKPPAGLCQYCRYGKQVVSGKGSSFLLCLLHERDPHFAKYPHLPVLCCSGYVPRAGEPPP